MLLKMKRVGLILMIGVWGVGCSGPATKGQVAPTAGPGPKPTLQNSPPVIQGNIEILPKYVPPGGEAFARVSASDPDQDKLQYSWTVEGGEIIEGSTSSVLRWKSGTQSDKVVLTVTVKDGKNYVDKSITVNIAAQFLEVEIPTAGPIKKGMHFLVYLSASSFDQVSAFSVKLQYDPTKVELIRVIPDGILKNKGVLTALQFVRAGTVQVAFWQTEGDGIQGSGLLASVLMRALADLTDANVPLMEVKWEEFFPTFRNAVGKDLPVGIRAKKGGGKILVEEKAEPSKEDKKTIEKEEKSSEGKNQK